MKKIILFSSSFLWVENKKGLIYNVDTHSSLLFDLSDNLIRDICDQWLDINNLYTASFDEANIGPVFLSFAEAIKNKGLGFITDDKDNTVSLPPVLKIKHSVENKDYFHGTLSSGPVLMYLMKLRVFMGGQTEECSWWKQSLYPISSNNKIDVYSLLVFLQQCDSRLLANIDLVISKWDTTNIACFAKELTNYKQKVRFFFAHPDPAFRNDILDCLADEGYAVIQVCPPDLTKNEVTWIPGRKYHLLIRSEEEYAHWESLLDSERLIDYKFKPIAENNIDFFRNNIFLSEEEILGQKLTKKDIFRHQSLNMNQFGIFYIFPDGTIHPAADAPAIGTLEDPVHHIIIRELEENHAWLQTRRLMSPCKDCIYHDLCPSPSVYERILGVPACTVKQV